MKRDDILLAAGFMEGEGCFRCGHSPFVSGAQHPRNAWPLRRLKRVFGGSIYKRDKPWPLWVWHASGPRALNVMQVLYPHLSPWRKKQIRKALRKAKSRPGVARGERHARAKLTAEQVRKIRALPKRGAHLLARRYGVSQPTIWNIWAHRIWTHV